MERYHRSTESTCSSRGASPCHQVPKRRCQRGRRHRPGEHPDLGGAGSPGVRSRDAAWREGGRHGLARPTRPKGRRAAPSSGGRIKPSSTYCEGRSSSSARSSRQSAEEIKPGPRAQAPVSPTSGTMGPPPQTPCTTLPAGEPTGPARPSNQRLTQARPRTSPVGRPAGRSTARRPRWRRSAPGRPRRAPSATLGLQCHPYGNPPRDRSTKGTPSLTGFFHQIDQAISFYLVRSRLFACRFFL